MKVPAQCQQAQLVRSSEEILIRKLRRLGHHGSDILHEAQAAAEELSVLPMTIRATWRRIGPKVRLRALPSPSFPPLMVYPSATISKQPQRPVSEQFSRSGAGAAIIRSSGRGQQR